MSKTGNGATIALSVTGATLRVTEIVRGAESIPVLDDTALSTTGDMEKCPGDLRDREDTVVRGYWDADDVPPLTGTLETITITEQVPEGKTNGATYSGTGFISSRDAGTMANNQRRIGEFTITFDGKTGPTYTAST